MRQLFDMLIAMLDRKMHIYLTKTVFEYLTKNGFGEYLTKPVSE